MNPDIYRDITSERFKQIQKWGNEAEQLNKHDSYRSYCQNKLSVLIEEIGEVARAVNDQEGFERIREELIQVAAVTVAWIETIQTGKRCIICYMSNISILSEDDICEDCRFWDRALQLYRDEDIAAKKLAKKEARKFTGRLTHKIKDKLAKNAANKKLPRTSEGIQAERTIHV